MNEGDFEEVNAHKFLTEDPEGFYSHYNDVPAKNRSLCLIRLPPNMPMEVLDQLEVGDVSTDDVLGRFEWKGVRYELFRTEEPAGSTLLIPLPSGELAPDSKSIFSASFIVVLETGFAELWTVRRVREVVDAGQGEPLDFDGDIGGRGQPRKQPQDLRMGLSAADLSTVLQKGKRSNDHADDTSKTSPKKSSKRKK